MIYDENLHRYSDTIGGVKKWKKRKNKGKDPEV